MSINISIMKQSVLTVVAVMFVCLLNCSCGNETSKDTLTKNTTTKKDQVAKQKVIIKPNGYKGNLFIKKGASCADLVYFYLKRDTTVELYKDDGVFCLENGTTDGFSTFGFKINDNGRFILSSLDSDKVELTVVKDTRGNDSIPILSLKTCTVKIKMNNLQLPYNLSAFKLKEGEPNTCNNIRHFISHDDTFVLIKGMHYSIDNGGFATTSSYSTAFTLMIDKNGIVTTDNYGAATI